MKTLAGKEPDESYVDFGILSPGAGREHLEGRVIDTVVTLPRPLATPEEIRRIVCILIEGLVERRHFAALMEKRGRR